MLETRSTNSENINFLPGATRILFYYCNCSCKCKYIRNYCKSCRGLTTSWKLKLIRRLTWSICWRSFYRRKFCANYRTELVSKIRQVGWHDSIRYYLMMSRVAVMPRIHRRFFLRDWRTLQLFGWFVVVDYLIDRIASAVGIQYYVWYIQPLAVSRH